jgi:hypothetical protein
MTPLKPKSDFDSPYLILKRTSSKTISWVNIPIRCNYFKQKKWRNSKLHFQFQRCNWHRWNRFWRLLKRLSRWIRSHMRNGFSLLPRDLYGVDWWKKPRVENLVTLSLLVRIPSYFSKETSISQTVDVQCRVCPVQNRVNILYKKNRKVPYIFSASFVIWRSTKILIGIEAGEAKRSEKFEAKQSEKKRKNWFFVFAWACEN